MIALEMDQLFLMHISAIFQHDTNAKNFVLYEKCIISLITKLLTPAFTKSTRHFIKIFISCLHIG